MKKRKDGLYVKTITIDGKRQYFYGESEPEINRKIANFRREEKKPKILLFEKAADEWDKEHTEHVMHNTAECYRRPLKDVKEKFGKYSVDDIESSDIKSYLKELQKKDLARNTINHRRIVLKQVFDYCIIKKYISVNPVLAVPLPRNLKSTRRDQITDEVFDIIKKHVSEPYGMLPYLMMFTGLRPTEALALTWGDIDFESGTINVDKVIEYFSNSPHVRHSTKSKSSTRKVLLLDVLKTELTKFKPKKTRSDDIIFNVEGKHLTKWEYRKQWDIFCNSVGIKNTTLYQLRHTYATLLFDAGVSAKDAQKLLGHSSTEITMNVYTHIREQREKLTATKINEYIATR